MPCTAKRPGKSFLYCQHGTLSVHDPVGARGDGDLAHLGEQIGADRDAGLGGDFDAKPGGIAKRCRGRGVELAWPVSSRVSNESLPARAPFVIATQSREVLKLIFNSGFDSEQICAAADCESELLGLLSGMKLGR